jgi:uncharacterized membrane protein
VDQHTVLLILGGVGSVVSSALGQHFLKASPTFSTNAAHVAQFVVAAVLYALTTPFNVASPEQWVLGLITWAMGLGIGSGSVLAGAGIVAKTR